MHLNTAALSEATQRCRNGFASSIHPLKGAPLLLQGKEQTFACLIHWKTQSFQFRYRSVTSGVEVSITKMASMAQTRRPHGLWVLPETVRATDA